MLTEDFLKTTQKYYERVFVNNLNNSLFDGFRNGTNIKLTPFQKLKYRIENIIYNIRIKLASLIAGFPVDEYDS